MSFQDSIPFSENIEICAEESMVLIHSYNKEN